MERRNWSLTTAKTVTLAAAVAGAGLLAVGSSDAGNRPNTDMTPASPADREVSAELLDGVLLDLTTARVFVAGDALPDTEFLVVANATVLAAGRRLELLSAEFIDDLSALGGPPTMQSGVSHVCALEDGVTWETADGGCKDLLTGLVWSRSDMGEGGAFSWGFSEQFIAESTEGGFDDWRMPTIEELQTVVAHDAETHFSGFGPVLYWSDRQRGNWAWAIRFWTGEENKVWIANPPGGSLSFVGVRVATVTPVCGDGNCDPGETPCNCPADCGPPPSTETDCSNGVDDDCDGLVDCDDGDCAGSPDCVIACNGNGICDPGEDCDTCPNDCDSKTNGRPSGRYCCGNGVLEGPEGDGRCDGNY